MTMIFPLKVPTKAFITSPRFASKEVSVPFDMSGLETLKAVGDKDIKGLVHLLVAELRKPFHPQIIPEVLNRLDKLMNEHPDQKNYDRNAEVLLDALIGSQTPQPGWCTKVARLANRSYQPPQIVPVPESLIEKLENALPFKHYDVNDGRIFSRDAEQNENQLQHLRDLKTEHHLMGVCWGYEPFETESAMIGETLRVMEKVCNPETSRPRLQRICDGILGHCTRIGSSDWRDFYMSAIKNGLERLNKRYAYQPSPELRQALEHYYTKVDCPAETDSARQ
jgi:hypothetical protein